MQVAEVPTAPQKDQDAALSAAILQARASIRKFFAAHRLPRHNQTDFRIQAVFNSGEEREYLWLTELDFRTRPATGVVSEKPRTKAVRYRQRVPFLPDQMTDWMFHEDGRPVGGFTTRVLQRNEAHTVGLLDRIKRRFIM